MTAWAVTPSYFKFLFSQGKPFRACAPFCICPVQFLCRFRIVTGTLKLRFLSFFLCSGFLHMKRSFPSITNQFPTLYNWTLFLYCPITVMGPAFGFVPPHIGSTHSIIYLNRHFICKAYIFPLPVNCPMLPLLSPVLYHNTRLLNLHWNSRSRALAIRRYLLSPFRINLLTSTYALITRDCKAGTVVPQPIYSNPACH